MTQTQLNRAVAQATGESLRTVHARGFSALCDDFEEREPLVMDWDGAPDVSELAQLIG